jgi:HEAT repeat protein
MRAADATLPLLDNVTHEDRRISHISRLALFALAELAEPALINELQNTDDVNRQQLIIELLGDMDSIKSVSVLGTFLKKDSISVRRAALRSLAKLPNEEAVRLLVSGLEDPFWTIRETAASLLTSKGNVVVELLISSLPDEKDIKAGYLQRILEQITGESFGTDRAGWEKWWDTRKTKGI